MALLILRFVFIMVASGIGIYIIRWSGAISEGSPPMTTLAVLFGMILLSLGVIVVDIAVPKKRLDVISAVYFGIIVGLILTYVTSSGAHTAVPRP